MTWSFRKRIKIIPGVHLNIGKRGISTSIGVRGASITVGHSGTYLNASIPGMGISSRTKISSNRRPTAVTPPVIDLPYSHLDQQPIGNIFSADVHEITSQGMQGLKETILLARAQRQSLRDDLKKIRQDIESSKRKRRLSYLFLYGYINRSIPKNLTADIYAQEEAIRETALQLDQSCIQLDAEFDPELATKYKVLVDSFQELTRCHQIWDITSAQFEDRAITRSSASTVVTRRNVHFALRSIPEFRSDLQVLYFQNANGADLYIYPNFIVMYAESTDFAVIGLDEIDLQYAQIQFTETQPVPADATTVDYTWAKVNKDGTRDRRFSDNYQIPVVQYGNIRLKTNTGLHEEYQFSNYASTVTFAKAFREYQQSINNLVPTI